MIKVYFAEIGLLEELEVFEAWFASMHPIRKEKILRCKQELDKKRSLLAGILLKMALEREGFVYESLLFEVEAHGRPVLKNVDNLHFSLSHAGDYALCCISDLPVGADIEVMGKSIFEEGKADRMHVMAKKVCSEAEYSEFLEVDVQEKLELFLKYWTRKECYSKAMGEGLRMEFSKIDTILMEDSFWSDWLTKDCFASVYSTQETSIGIELLKIESITDGLK